ncbi:M56 family metallopeptidase [Verrucomicrobiaceae bacterium 227]
MIVELINQHAEHLTRVGLHFLWQGTAIAILAALATRFLIKSPRHRSTVHLLGLIALSLCVPVTWIMLKETPIIAALQPALPQAIPQEIAPGIALEPSAHAPASASPLPPSVWIVSLYLLGLTLMLVRVLRGYQWSHQIRRHGKPVTEASWTEALTLALESMSHRSQPAMIWSQKVASPVVTGILRPMIVLPVSLMSGLPREQAIAVLSHELAHLRRFDHLIVVFQRLLEALFFFHPAVWFLSRRLDQEREKSCDDLVIKAGHNRADYAEALVNLASETRPTLALAAAKNAHLKERIFRILNHPQPTTVQVNRGGWLTIATAILALGFISLTPAQSQEKEADEKPTKAELSPREKKLQIVIPKIDFTDAGLEEAIEFLRIRSIELDPTPQAEGRGLNFVVRSTRPNEKPKVLKIDRLVAKDFTIQQTLEAICKKTNTRYKIDEYAITILSGPKTEDEDIIQRRWQTHPNFLAQISAAGIEPESKSLVEHLEARGVSFGPYAAASYLRGSSSLIVRNTPENLKLIDDIVKATVDPEKLKNEKEARERNHRELQAIIIPKVDFRETTLQEAVDFLRLRALELDPAKKGINVNIFGEDRNLSQRKIESLELANVPLLVALQYICQISKARYVVEGRNIFIFPLNEETEEEKAAKAAWQKKIEPLKKIIIPEIRLEEATLAEAVEFLRLRSLEVDPTKKGVNINILSDDKNLHLINLNMRKVPLTVVLQYICEATKTRYTVEGRNISIVPGKGE